MIRLTLPNGNKHIVRNLQTLEAWTEAYTDDGQYEGIVIPAAYFHISFGLTGLALLRISVENFQQLLDMRTPTNNYDIIIEPYCKSVTERP
jgi:hypothetical protein